MYHINKEIIASGESITLENTAKYYFKKFDILGNSIQEGTPSIDSEAPIESVGDNIQLFDKGTIKSKYILNGDGTITTSSFNTFATDYIEVEGNKDYAISGMPTLTSEYPLGGSTGNWRLAFYDINKNFISLISKSNINEATFLIPTNCKYVVFGNNSQFSSLDILNSFINNNQIKLSKGTSTGPWSPYGQGSIEIHNCNENLFDKSKTLSAIGGVSGYVSTDYIPAKVGDVIKKNNKTTLFFYNSAKKQVGSAATWTTGTVTIENTAFIKCNVLETEVDTFMLVKNQELPSEYVQGQSQTKTLHTQQPFRRNEEVSDLFIKKEYRWYEQHNIKRKIFDGTESWSMNYGENLFSHGKLNDQNTKNLGSSNYFKFDNRVSAMTGLENNEFALQPQYNGIFFKNTEISSVEEWIAVLVKLNEEGRPLYVDYVLAEPELIPCTPEQVEQLEYFEKEAYSYDETTNIYSTNEVSPYFEVTAYQRISEEFKTRLREGKITRGYLKVLANDIYPEIIIDENNYLKDLKIEELRYIPDEGFIGGTVAKRVSGNFNNVDSSFNIQDREIEVYLGVELEDETTEYIKYGTYIVQRPEDDQVNDNTSFEALDYMVKFNQEYKDRITYPCTLKQLLDDILDQAGVNSKVATFGNSDFIVENNQFEQGTTLRDVLKAITQVAFNWSRIDADDNLVMDFEIREETDEYLGTDDYFNFKKSDGYGPVNVIVLRNSQIEGENVTIKDENLINSPKGYNILNTSGFIKNNLLNVEVTRNEDGSFTINGTTDANSGDIRIIYEKPLIIPAGDCTFTYGINGLNMFNNEVNLSSLGKGTYMAIKRMAVSSSKTTLTFENDFEIYNYNIHLNPNTTFNNLTIKPMIYKGHNEKQFQPYIPIGEIEYVISDNPFAYTELKRKQLIEAGRRLFGLRYTPMAVDMLGLMYLNAKDRISVENLNGEKFNTYLLDHTIDYTGIVLDSMQSQAKTKTETKYQYISSLAQGLSHVEIKVDKVNKKIESIVQTQEDVSEKVAKTVARIEVVYALSDSPTTEPTNGWSTTAPEWTAGKYMWQKTITTYANGTTAETAATNISGAKGAPGQNGVGIIQTNITYQKSTSGTTVPTGTWQTTIPEVNEDGYLWTRTEFIYSDGSKKYAYNVGKKGAAGIGVKSLVDQYYLSTSNTEQTGGEWTETQPEWQDKTYIWTRTKINWTDNSITYTDPVLANTLNDINSNIVVLRELSSSQIVANGKIITRIEETTKKLNNDYSTTEQVDSKIDGLEDKYETLEKRFVDIEASNKEYAIKINAIDNNGVDKIKTLMGYTFNDEGLNIDRPGADTATLVNEKGVEVSDKTGASSTPLLYAGYVEEGNDKFPNYEGQTIVATSNLIVKNFLVIGSNSRFQDYINPVLGGQGTGAYDI